LEYNMVLTNVGVFLYQYIKSVFPVFSLLGDFTFLLCSCFEKVQIIGIFSLASKHFYRKFHLTR